MQPSDLPQVMYKAAMAELNTLSSALRSTPSAIGYAIAAAITTMPDDLLRKLCEERRCVMVPRGVLEVLLALAGVPLNHPQRQQYDDAVRVAREAMGVGSMASDPRQQAQDDGKEQP